jgi:FAD/FMN-containing dehydrogenase
MSATSAPTIELDALAGRIAGELVLPRDAGFDDARRAWQAGFDQRPLAVAFPADADDVATIVREAGERGFRVAPQGTGHNAAARGSVADAILLRTDRLRSIEVDADARTCRVGAGVQWLEALRAIEPTGLVAICGSSPNVGIVGFSLGGGIGWLSRKLGLASESLLAVEIVTGDGRVLRASADEHADLFWALRGGSGSFGVVTAVEFRLHPTTGLYGGAMFFDWSRAAEVLQAWRAWTATAPESVTTSARILQIPPLPGIPEALAGRAFVVLDGCVSGTPAEAEAILAPLRALGPEMDGWGPMTLTGLAHLHMDPEEAPPVPLLTAHEMLDGLSAEAVDALVAAAGPDSGSVLAMVELRHVGGALGRRPAGCGALGRLDAEFVLFAGGLGAPEILDAVTGGLDAVRGAVAGHATGGFYLNFREQPSDVADAFAIDVHTRLRAVKRDVDRQDVVQANHPVRPLPA